MKLRKYNVNDSAFSVLTIDSCYWAGFIAADGYIFKRKNGITKQLQITLHKKDLEQLQDFKKWVQFIGPIRKELHKTNYGNMNSVKISITSSQIVNDLEKYFNIIPNKSKTLKPPNLHKREFILAFVKGYTDGNGTINHRPKVKGKNKLYWELCSGSKKFLKWVKFFIDQNYSPNQNRKVNINRDRTAFRLTYGGARGTKILNDLYNHPFHYGLKRKWDVIYESF